MITETKETNLTILNGGIINVMIITHYLKDGNEIGQESWGCCLEPHPAYLEQAEEILDPYHLNIVKAAWSDEIMMAYNNSAQTLEEPMVEDMSQQLARAYTPPTFRKLY